MEEFIRDRLLEELSALGEDQVHVEKQIDEKFDDYWNSLSKEEQMASFYSVVKRIVESEKLDRGYKYILWDHFNFPKEAYHLGILCNFMWLHNHIVP
jgi:hypothetical protein